MPSGFGELTDQAHDLVSSGDLAGAQRLLADALTGADPRPANATPEMAEAAGLHARVLVALGEPHSARGWAAYAYAATTRLHGRSDPRTVAAAATLAAVLHRVGSWSRAARLYQEVIIELTASDGPESLRVLAAHADLATVEYARGQCQVARDRLQDAWELHREVYGDGQPSGIKMLARLGSMQRDCGQFTEAQDHLALARELARRHLAPDDPLTAQVASLSRAPANPDHVCADTPPVGAEGSVVPAARTPSQGDAPPSGDWAATAAAPPDWSDPDPDTDDRPDDPRADWSGTDPTRPPTATPPASGPASTWTAAPSAPAPDPTWTASSPPDAGTTPNWTASGPAGSGADPGGWPDPDDVDRDWTTSTGATPNWTADDAAWDGTGGPQGWPAEATDGRTWPAGYQADWPTGSTGPAGWPATGDPADARYAGEQHPPEGYHPGQGHPVGQQPAGAASPVPTPRQPADGPAGPPQDWWTGQPTEPASPDPAHPARPTPTPSAESSGAAVPPSVMGLTGPAPQAPGVYRLRRLEPERTGPSSRLLPVPVRRPPAAPSPRPNRLVPIIAAGVVVVLLGAAAVIAGVSRVDGPGEPGSPTAGDAPSGAATPSASAPEAPPASPGAPPTELSLRDNRDSVTLRWAYPAGAEGPVIISGGRSGQPKSPFADLPAGTDSFVVYGLNRSLDYCFTVAVAWSTDTVARSDEVCTERR
ncbi:tetratricopeptide repeat protein [Micromonospora sp. NPDC003816]|uniref:tetratricopeptide repeat protein n=1 Tax=Micromonospora sp. NPDC003816 TaxID=3364224 RepID=UPI003683FDE7